MKTFIAVASILDRTVLREKYLIFFMPVPTTMSSAWFRVLLSIGNTFTRCHVKRSIELLSYIQVPIGEKRSYHHAGVIVPGYREELGLLLFSRGRENLFGTQVILLGASCYSLVCCDGKWPRSTSIT